MGSPTGPASSVLPPAAATDRGCRHQLLGLPTLLLDVPVTTASDLAHRSRPLLTHSGDARHGAG